MIINWFWLTSLFGILATSVVVGTDVFFLTVGASALRLTSTSAATEVMGYFHLFGDARMPIWGVTAMACNGLLAAVCEGEPRWLHFAALMMMIAFVLVYSLWSKPINRAQTKAARDGEVLAKSRELQDSWNRSLSLRVPLLAAALIVQCISL